MSNRGMTLIEAILVVVIIAILATIAVPQYKSFAAKARQKEGFALMNAFFVAATATHAEFGIYPGNFVQTGFQPTGVVNYRLRSSDGNNLSIALNDNSCITTWNGRDCDCGGTCPNFKTWTEPNEEGLVGVRLGPDGTLCSGFCCTEITDDTFQFTVASVISLSATTADKHSMDHTKTIVTCQDGLR